MTALAGLDELIKARDQKRAKTAQLVKQVRTHTVTPPKVTRPAGAIAQPIDKPSVLRATGESARNALYGVGAGFANTLRTRFAQNAQNEAEMLDIFNHYGGGREASIAQARSKQQQWENQIKASNANLLEKNQAWNKKYAALPAPVKWTANAVGQTAQMAPAITAGLLGGPLYAGAALGTQVHGNSVGQALGDGAALTQAVHYGQAEALKEMAVEKMFGFMPGFGKGMVNVNKVLANASRPAQIAARTTLGTIGEGVEEGVAQIATPFLQRATYAPNAPNATSGEVLDAAGQGMIGGLLLGGAGNLYQTRLIAKAAPEATAQEEADRIIHDQNAAKEQQTAQEPQMTTAQEMQTDPTSAGEDSTAQQVHVNHRQNITDADPSTLNDRAVRYINRASAKAGLRYRVVDGLSPDVAAYIEGDTIVYNAQTLDDPQAVRKATAHEVYHSLLGTDEHSRLMDIAVDYYGNEGRVSVEHLIAAKKDEYAEYGVELDDHAALDEIGAEFMEAVLSDERTANRILTEQPNLAQRILTYIRERLADFKAMRGMSEAEKRQYSMLRQAQALYEQGLKTRGRQGADGKRYQIIDGTGKNGESQSYVKADRQVISGEDPKQWGQQVKRYINEKIRQNQDVYLMADNGDVLAITRNTAGKAAFRNKVKNRQQYARPMTDQEYKAKLNAEGHIDELAVISIPDSWNEDAGNKHEKRGMAQQGWDYRTAYFEDFDGSFYEVRISVSRDGDIREIYNVGQLNKRKNTVSTVGSSVRKDGARASILLGRRINNTEDISVSDASITNGEPLSNGLFDNLTPEQRKKLLGDEQNRRYKINGRNFKEQQLAILQNSNPMQDNYHTGIRSAKDILSFQEAIEEDVFTPDYTAAMAQNALRKGMITVYSSYPITQGIFVTPSKMEAQSYAGGNKIYSRTVNLEQVAWIDSLEGQFADIGQRYSLSRAEGQKSRFEQLLEEYGAFPEGESPRTTSDARTPQQTDPDNRVNRFARNAMEAPNINDDIRQGMRDEMSDDIASGRFVYESISNKILLDKANQTLIQKGYEAAVNEFRTLFTSGRRMNASDIALGERLITEASKRGDTETAIQLIADVATLGTEMGQAVQALRLLKRMTPEGRLMLLERTVQRINGKLTEEGKPPVALNPRFQEAMLRQETVEGMDQVQTDALLDIAEQMPATMADKINAWRYLSMLGNPRTHIRNIVGNAVFTPVRAVRNLLSFTGEQLLPSGIERTKALHIRPEYCKFAEADYEQVKEMISSGGSKYDMFTQIEQQKRIFKNPIVEKPRKWNENALEAEDMFFSRRAYVRALAGYMQANHLSPDYLQSGTKKSGADFQRAQNYAVREAQKATFRDYSGMASALNQFERKNAVTRVIGGAVMPFKKTPINILKRGVEYSPAGLAEGLTRGVYQVAKGKITPAEFIDKITTGLTGSGILALGYFLTSLGLLSAGEDDPRKKAAYDRALGSQNYAVDFDAVNRVFNLNLPNGTYTIDWMAPAVMPLMTGVELYNALNTEYGDDVAPVGQVVTQLTKVVNPVLETSMMQGLLDVMQSFQTGTGGQLVDMAGSMASSYGGQFVPTLAGQAARTIDETKRSTYAPTNSPYTQGGERFGRQMMAKLPGASKLLEPQVDVWGREVKQPGGNMAARAVNNMLNPGLYKPNTETDADRKLTALYDKTGESKVLPAAIGKAIEYGDRRYPLKAREYTEMQKQVGSRRYADVQRLQRSVYTKELDDSQMGNVVANLYEYRAKEAKAEYLRGKGVAYEDSGYWKAKEAEQSGVALIDYFAVKQIFGGDYKDAKAKYDDMHYLEITPEEYLTTKQAFGSNSGYTYDQAKYNLVVCKALDMQPADYQTAIKDISKLKSDEDYSGKSINNSKKEKILAYVNGLNISTGAKRYLFYSYYPTEKTGVYNYINSLPLTTADKRALWNIKVNPQQTQYNRWIDGLTIGAQDKARLKQRPYAEKSADTRKYINSLPLTAQEKKLLWEQKIPS